MATGETLTSAGTALHLVIIVPGIRDRGLDWHIVRRELEAADFVVTITGWSEYFGIPRFLVPAPMFRRLAMNSLQQKIEDAVKTYTVGSLLPHVSYIAHSFGSYILCYLLRRRYHLRTHRLILCGSVLPRTFKFSGFEGRFDGPVINDIGTKDYWPFVASCVTFGYGTIGTFGYAGEPVVDRFHKDADHGRFTEEGFCTKYLDSLLSAKGRDGIVIGDKLPKEGTLRKSFMRLLQNLKWVVLVGFVWIAGASPADMYCQSELQPVHFLASGERDTRLVKPCSDKREKSNGRTESSHLPIFASRLASPGPLAEGNNGCAIR